MNFYAIYSASEGKAGPSLISLAPQLFVSAKDALLDSRTECVRTECATWRVVVSLVQLRHSQSLMKKWRWTVCVAHLQKAKLTPVRKVGLGICSMRLVPPLYETHPDKCVWCLMQAIQQCILMTHKAARGDFAL